MAVTYTKEQQKFAKANELSLGTVAVAGLEFQGPLTATERDELLEFWLAFIKRRSARPKAEVPDPVKG